MLVHCHPDGSIISRPRNAIGSDKQVELGRGNTTGNKLGVEAVVFEDMVMDVKGHGELTCKNSILL